MPLTALRTQTRLPTAWLSFDGVDDYVEVADSDSLNIIDAITIEAWVCRTGDSTDLFAVIVGKSMSLSYSIFFETGENKARFRLRGLSPVDEIRDPEVSFPLNTWVHVVGTYDGSIMKLYVNHIVKVTANTSGSIGTSADPLEVGSAGDRNYWFAGCIAEVRVYNRALSESEIQYNMFHWGNPIRNGLVLWLSKTSINPPAWNDQSGYGNDGTIYGAQKIEHLMPPLRTNTATRVLAAAR